MSFDVYLQFYEEGQPAGVPHRAVRETLGVPAEMAESGSWRVDYDEWNGCDLSIHALAPDDALVHAITVSRPCGDLRLWEALFRVMGLGNGVFYFPGSGPPIVVKPAAERHLPADMMQALGRPVCVHNAQDIVEHVQTA